MRMPAALRQGLERVLRNHTSKARFPQRYGGAAVYLSGGNHLAVLKPGQAKFDHDLLGFVDRFVREGSVVWDIGVNMGLFSVPAASKARQVVGFEPDPFNLRLLQKTREANPGLPLQVLPVAIADKVGVMTLNVPERGRSANSLAGVNFGTQMGGVRYSFDVPTVTLDWVLEQYGQGPDFIKCDAEGAELMILYGATRVLAESRPVIVMEMPVENSAEADAIFRANQYRLFSAYEPIALDREFTSSAEGWDVLAVPAEKLDAMLLDQTRRA